MNQQQNFENQRWQTTPEKTEVQHQWVARMIKPHTKVLDVGCGNGLLLDLMPKETKKEGLDLSKESAKICMKKGYLTAVCDVSTEKLLYVKNEFDVITMIALVEHFFQPSEVLERLSKHGKLMILVVPNFGFIKDRLKVLSGGIHTNMQEKKGHCYYLTRPQMHQILKRAKLQIIKEKPYYPLKIPFWPNLLSTMSLYVVMKQSDAQTRVCTKCHDPVDENDYCWECLCKTESELQNYDHLIKELKA